MPANNNSLFEAIRVSSDIDEKHKQAITTILMRKGWTTIADLLAKPLDVIAPAFPTPEMLTQIIVWRKVEMWKIEKLPNESTYFHAAAKTGNMIAARDILTRYDLPSASCRTVLANHADRANQNRTPLFDASINGHPGMVRLLVDELNANVHHIDATNSLAIHLAADNGRLHCVMFLTEKYPDLLMYADKDNNTPLTRAASHGQIAVVEYLVSKRAYMESYDAGGRTALLKAAANGHLNVVKFLVTKGAGIFAQEMTVGNMAVHLAAEEGHTAVVAFFLESNPEFRKTENRVGKTPLDLARDRNQEDVVRLLESSSSSITVYDYNSSSHSSLPIVTPRVIEEQPIVARPDAPSITSMTDDF